MDLAKRLEAYRQQEQHLSWEGTFAEYFEMVTRNPKLARHAHARIYDMIISHGVEEVDGHRRYRFFEQELFGLERPLERLVEEYFHAAARRLDVRRRILLLMGPVSGGKSTIVNMLKRGLVQYTRTDEGAVYAIKGCPMHEDPLHLIPHELRPEVERDFGIKIEGSLCPSCQLMVREHYRDQIEEVLVHRIVFSEEQRIGIGTFQPSDPKSQDIADLTGSIDFSTVTEYGSESDPRAYRFDGELNIANRGIMEFQEMLKADEKFLWNLLSLSQEGTSKPAASPSSPRTSASSPTPTRKSTAPLWPTRRTRPSTPGSSSCPFPTTSGSPMRSASTRSWSASRICGRCTWPPTP